MCHIRLLFAALLTFCASFASAQYLDLVSGELAPYQVPANLVRDHLTGSGIEILDVQFSGAPQAVGYFTGGDAAIGLNRGLIMTTGRASTKASAYGAEQVGSTFANNSNGIDIDDPLLGPLATGSLKDLVRFRITFRASSNSIHFRYVFASEEYPEYSCSTFNDIFGFFLEGPGFPAPVNIALVPGSNLPVAINNVHPANSVIPNCTPLNAQFYHSNLNSSKQPTYDGFLDVFTAEADVQPCAVYVMTLVIADIGDYAFDSAVFLEANSFSGDVDIAASFDPGEAILPENAAADTVFLHFNNIPQSLLPLTVTIGGTATNGVDYEALDSVIVVTDANTVLPFLIQPLPDTLQELVETITLTVRDSGCFYRNYTIYLADPDDIFTPLDSLVHTGNNLLTAPVPTALNNISWSVSNDQPLSIDPPQTMVFSDVMMQAPGMPGADFPLTQLIDPGMLESVCFNIEHAFDSDLSLYLFAPNGQFLELSTKNGGNGDNYVNTCFSPTATQPITFGLPFAPSTAAPFTGTFQPEGEWADLLDAPLEGAWRLGILDNFTGIKGQLLNWTLSFSTANLGKFQYLWSTGATTKTITVTDPGTYTVTISNAIASFTKTFVVYTSCNTSDSLTVVITPGESYDFGGQILSQPGEYSQTLPASNGCDSIVYLHLVVSTATVEPEGLPTVYFSPNPANGETTVAFGNGAALAHIRAYDISGRQIFSEKISGATSSRLNTAAWVPSWYIVELEDRTGTRIRGRLLVQ